MRRLAALVALLTAFSSAQMQKSREVRSHEEYHKKRQDQLNRKAQSRKNALKKGGTQSKTLHELRMKKQHKNLKELKTKPKPLKQQTYRNLNHRTMKHQKLKKRFLLPRFLSFR